jgi:hypothetical protein
VSVSKFSMKRAVMADENIEVFKVVEKTSFRENFVERVESGETLVASER